MYYLRISDEPLNVAELYAKLVDPKYGGIDMFVGTIRLLYVLVKLCPFSRSGWEHVPPECGFQNLAVGNAGAVRVDRPDSGGDLIG